MGNIIDDRAAYYAIEKEKRDARFKEVQEFDNLLNGYRIAAKKRGERKVYFPKNGNIYSFEVNDTPPDGTILHSALGTEKAISIGIDRWLEYATYIPICLNTQYPKFHFEFIKKVEIVKAKDALYNMHYLSINDKNVTTAYTEQKGHRHWDKIAIPYSIWEQWKQVFENTDTKKQLDLFGVEIYYLSPLYNTKKQERIHLTIGKKAFCGIDRDFENRYTIFSISEKEIQRKENICLKCSKAATKIFNNY